MSEIKRMSELRRTTDTRTTFQLSRKAIGTSPSKPKTILRTKSIAVNVYYDGKNLTPKPLNPEVYRQGKERQLGVFDDISVSGKESSSTAGILSEAPKSSIRFRTDQQTGTTTFQGSIFHGSVAFLDPVVPSDFLEETREEVSRTESELLFLTASQESLERSKMKKTPTHISLILSETNTFFILDITSCTALKDTEEGDLVEEKNRDYEYITEGKGRNRKVVNAEAQTVLILKKTRNTVAETVKSKNSTAFASNWEMHDTYYAAENKGSDESDDSNRSEIEFFLFQDSESLDSYRMSPDEKQLSKLMKNSRFQEALCVIERLLANNCFNEEQKRFRGLSDPDPFREDINYKYSLKLLWTFANSNTKDNQCLYLIQTGRCVTSLHWNPCNKDVVAVSYGKFYFADSATGMVMVWNIKNPVQPERMYHFDDPVTSLSFSNKDPNLLAIGTYTGRVLVINIASRVIQIIAKNSPCYETVWSVIWRSNPDLSKYREQICATFDDGRVIFYTIENTKQLQAQQMMRVSKAEGKLKGFTAMRKCSNLNIPVSQYAGARFLRWHPEDPTMYLVGTNEGVVHKCSTNYLNQHLDLFMAHGGPINDLKYSPFSTKIYATCGDDWFLRIWAEGKKIAIVGYDFICRLQGISDPLHELFVTMNSVQSMDWSPTHSTILATIYGKTILLWDFQRKVWKPQSETKSPSGSRNTFVQFIDSGRCLVVGDIDGNVHVFALEDMPFPAFFQANLLFDALEKSLMTQPPLMEKIKKLRTVSVESNLKAHY